MGALITGSNPASVANQYLANYFSKDMLKYIEPILVLAQFAKRVPLPSKSGAKSVRMFRFGAPSTSDIQALTEGTSPANNTYRELAIEYVDVSLSQYGQTIALSDLLDETEFLNYAQQAVKTNAEDCGLHLDTIIRNEIKTHTGTSGGVDYSTQNFVYGGTGTSFATVYNTGTYSSNYVTTQNDVVDAATALKIQNAPKIGGYYILAAPPQVTSDLFKITPASNILTATMAYQNKEAVYNGEIGKFAGFKVIEHTNPFRANTQGTYNASGVVFSTFAFGADAFGVTDLSGQSPFSPQLIFVNGADGSNPLAQRSYISFKTYYAAKLLQPKYLVQIYSQTGYGQ